MSTNDVIAQETARLRQKLGREPDGLEVTEAIILYDEAAEAAVIQALTRRGVYPVVAVLDVSTVTRPGLGLVLEEDRYYGRDNEAEVAQALFSERVKALRAAVDPTPPTRRAARILE